MKKTIFLILIICLMITNLFAQEPYYTDAQKKLMSRRAAMLDGYRQLSEIVQGVKIDATTTVKDFVTENDEIRAVLDSFVLRGAQVVATRYLPDETCEVDMQVSLGDVVGFLKTTQNQYNVNKFQRTNFDAMDSYNANRIFTVTGTGARPGGMTAQQAQSLRDENATLKAQVEALIQQLQEVNSGKEQLASKWQNDYNSLESQYKTSSQKYTSLEAQNAMLTQKCLALEEQNAGLVSKCNDLENRNNQSSQDLFKAWEQMQALKKQNEELNRSSVNTKKQITELAQLVIESKKQTEEGKKQISALQSSISTLQTYRQRYDELLVENKKLKEQAVVSENLRNQMNQLLIQVDRLSQNNQNLLNENQSLTSSNMALQNNYQALEKQVRGQQRLQADLENSQRLSKEIAVEKRKLELQLQDTQARLDAVQRENEQIKLSLQQLQSQINSQNVWRNASPAQKLMARRAAVMDAQRQLLETVQGIRINSTTLVRDFVVEKDEIVGSASGFLRGAQVVAERYLPDGTCEVDMVIRTEEFVRFLQQTSQQYQTKITPNEINKIYEYHKDAFIKATGTGAMK